MKSRRHRGFTLVELLVTVSIIAMLTGILLPVFGQIRRRARKLVGINNQRKIVTTLNVFALDNDEIYPESVATIGQGQHWNWQEPTMLTSYLKRSGNLHRSMGEYLRGYITDASIMFCPNAPKEYKNLQASWDAGDAWDDPGTMAKQDPVLGTYCFYWNYVGHVGGRRVIFKGPRGPGSCGGWESDLLVSDSLFSGHWRSPDSYGSCERFKTARDVVPEIQVASAYWSRPSGGVGLEDLGIRLNAGYTDGRVESFAPWDTIAMKIAKTPDGGTPYHDAVGLGAFYLPRNALP